MTIQNGEHIAICGRSGSGKTSLILSILNMMTLQNGSVEIDGKDISAMNCDDLRRSLNAVPQDPFLMPGTIRFNLDPFGFASEDKLTKALARVGLCHVIQEQGGLDAEMDTSAWSSGQKQLFCFARAMVKESKILILDEAMSRYVLKRSELYNILTCMTVLTAQQRKSCRI